MTTPTVEEKYEWLCKQLRVQSVDLWENDALLVMKRRSIYFQFSSDQVPDTVDSAVILAMRENNNG